jgi:hypothetical protein
MPRKTKKTGTARRATEPKATRALKDLEIRRAVKGGTATRIIKHTSGPLNAG